MYCAFSDESGTTERYQSVCVISGQKHNIEKLRIQVLNLLTHLKVSEIKWEQVKNHKPKINCALKLFELVVDSAASKSVRVDVICWDTQDKRHNIQGRDDNKNIHLMHYKVLKVMADSWNQKEWHYFPDETSSMDWAEIKKYLNRTSLRKKLKAIPHLFQLIEQEHYHRINIKVIDPKVSHDEPLVQTADLFAGITRFSKVKGETYSKWLKRQSDHPTLFDLSIEPLNTSKTDQNRFQVLKQLHDHCKGHKMQVNISLNDCLCTKNPKNFLNFWQYEPQHENDKAPTRLRIKSFSPQLVND